MTRPTPETPQRPRYVASPNVITAAVLVLTSAYATLRYAVFGDVSVAHLPLFVLNKAVAWSGLLFLVTALAGARSLGAVGRSRRAILIKRAIELGRVHVVASLALLGPDYYPTLYEPDGRLTLGGEVLVASGIGAAVYPISKSNWARFALFVALALHAGVLVVAGCAAPGSWPGALPPISWWSLATALFGLGFTGWHLRRHRASPTA